MSIGRTAARRVALAAVALVAATLTVVLVLAPPERCPAVTGDDLRASAGAAVDWFARNQNADGTWLYEYDAAADRVIPGYNTVRHSGAVMGLYQAATAGVPRAFESAERGLAWSLDHLVERDGWTAVLDGAQAPAGGTALLVAGLVERRELTGDHRYDDLLERMGRSLVAQTEPSGAVLAFYDLPAASPRAGEYSKYYTGETYWALARLHSTFPAAGFGPVADRVGAYLATQRDRAEDRWPPVPDHWVGYGLAETVGWPDRPPEQPLTPDEVDYARRQAGLFGFQARWVSQRFGPWGVAVRGDHVPRGGGYGVVGEALTGLWRVAAVEPRLASEQGAIGARALCIAGLAVRAQTTPAEAAAFAAPDRVAGAWFRHGVTRMDDQQHALDALLRTVAIADAQAAGLGDTSSSPTGPATSASGTSASGSASAAASSGSAAASSGSATSASASTASAAASSASASASSASTASAWLWGVALVAAWNPARVWCGLPRAGPVRFRARMAAAGGAAGSVLALALALAVAALAAALDISAASLAVAVGVVAGVGAIVAVLGRPPSPQPALAGARAALVPVAVPLVANPALVLLAAGSVADVGIGPVLLAVLAAMALLVGLAVLVPMGRVPDRVMAWAARTTGAVLLLTAVLLVIDGVLAV